MRRKYTAGRFVSFNRNIHKSIRLDDGIYNYIMQSDGCSFSDKLENLVLDHARRTGREEDINPFL